MINVMIVDDVPIFREYLREAIDWNRYGFKICCEAKNGKEALEKSEIYEPDIVLSDITMPFMDGITLAEKLKEINNDIEVVLITGNSEFEYARKALKLGVADYIVKPFEKEELIVSLLNLKDNINKTLEIEFERIDDRYKIQEEILKTLIYSKDTNHLKSTDLLCLDPNMSSYNYFYVTIIEAETSLETFENSEQVMNWRSVIGSLYSDYIQIDGLQHYFRDYEGRIVFLNSLKKKEDFNLQYDDIEALIKIIKERLNFNITVGVGRLYSSLASVRKSYLESLNALNNRFLNGSNQVINYDKIPFKERGYGFYSAEVNETIINNLNQLSVEYTLNVLESVFSEVDDLKYNFEYRRMVSMGLISLLLSYIVKVGKNINDIFHHEFSPYLIIQEASDAGQRAFILEAYKKVLEYLLKHKDTKSSKIANEAKKYIDDNYYLHDFNMNALSKQLLINQTYLRKMFKSEWHTTISEYLVKVRMENARKLIVESGYKLSIISEMVGYSDPGYFSKSFKRFYGVSPSDFKSH